MPPKKLPVIGVFSIIITFLVFWSVKAYVGDIDYDNLINHTDINIITTAFGSNDWSGDPDWNPAADLNEDDKIDIKDLAIVGRNYGLQHAFHQGRYFSNSSTDVFKLDACLDGQDQVHIVWSDTTNLDVFYTRLDRYGNTIIDDVLVDSQASTGTDIIAIACDKAGNAHIFWDCVSDVCQTRFDQWGYRVVETKMVDDSWYGAGEDGAAAMDSQGNAHFLYRMGSPANMVYSVFTGTGFKVLSLDESLIGDAYTSRYRQIAVDGDDNVHLVWSEEEGTDYLYYTKLATNPEESIATMQFGQPHWDGTVNDAHKPSLTVDSHGNAIILWNRADPDEIYLEVIDHTGSSVLDDNPIFPDWVCCYHQDIVTDQWDQLHLWAPTNWGSSLELHALGIFDNNGAIIESMKWAMYGRTSSYPALLIDSEDDLHLVYQVKNNTMDDPPCPVDQICYESTAFDPIAYDRTLPDLGTDAAHLSWSPTLARWGQTLVVTTTVFNSGWVGSPSTSARFEIVLQDDTVLDPPARADITVPVLNPRQSQHITATLDLPSTPPVGYEEIEYATLRISVDPADSISENTENNNQVLSPFMIQPLPTTAGLFLIVKDTTQSARIGSAVPLNTGTANLSSTSFERDISLKDYITVLADDLPIGSSVISYTVSWGSEGYHKPDTAEVGIVRNASDPYQVDFNPNNTIILETDSWGSLSGTITELGSGAPLSATVRILGQGINITTQANTSGQFSPTTEEKLGQLIPGQYSIHISAVDHARESDTVTIYPLGTHTWNRAMDKTEYAYVRGSVVNQFGRAVSGAIVSACAVDATTGSDGSFDLGEVDAACTLLEIYKSGYATLNENLVLTAGLEEYLSDLEMSFDPAVEIVQDQGGVAAWKQDESTADLLPDPPEDATWYEIALFDTFASKFWPNFRIQVWWGTYEFFVDATYTGPVEDRHLYDIQLRLIPTSFESHLVSGEATVQLGDGTAVKFPVGSFQTSGVMTALYVIEAWLVDADSGTVLQVETNPIEGGGAWYALEDQTRTYDFDGVTIDDWENAELWLFIKVGKNEGGSWTSSPILKGWHFDQQVLRLDLDLGITRDEYMIANFPIP